MAKFDRASTQVFDHIDEMPQFPDAPEGETQESWLRKEVLTGLAMRINPPHVDLDFDGRQRDRMVRYVTEKYGEEHTAMVSTFDKIKAKNRSRTPHASSPRAASRRTTRPCPCPAPARAARSRLPFVGPI